MNTNFGKRLKEAREYSGKSQRAIAQELGIDREIYAQFEEQEGIFIPLRHLNTMSNFINASVDYLFDFNNEIQYKNSKKDIEKTIIGKRLKDLRKANKLTQKELAKELDCARTSIIGYEQGQNYFSTTFLYNICKNYKVSADYLLGKTNRPKRIK